MKNAFCILIILGFLPMFTMANPPTQALGESFFTIQIGAFLNEQNARALEKKMILKGFAASVDESSAADGKKMYRVRIGRLNTKKEAEAYGQTFYKKEKIAYLVLFVSPRIEAPTAVAGDQTVEERWAPKKREEPSTAVAQLEKKEGIDSSVRPQEDQGGTDAAEKEGGDREGDEGLENALEKKSDQGPEVYGPVAPALKDQLDSSSGTLKDHDGKDEARMETKGGDAEEWPPHVSSIYAYRGPDDNLFVTNDADDIPEKYRERLESVRIFPVRFITFNLHRRLLYLQMGEEIQAVRLAGVDLSSPEVTQKADLYFIETLKDLPLRLEYSPKEGDPKSGILLAEISLKHGRSINLDMVRQGITPCYLGNLPEEKQKAFMEAEEAARKEKAGSWAACEDNG